MQRVVAGLMLLAVLASPGRGLAQHVHASADHQHDEHQHGAALHEHGPHHQAPLDATDDGPARLTACTPGDHAVAFQAVCEVQSTVIPIVALSARYRLPAPTPRLAAHRDAHDVRVHGPPLLTLAPSRAPPPRSPA